MEFDKVQSSGDMKTYDTGARRDTAIGKGRYDLLPTYAIHRLARHFENGAVKYGDSNWRKGIPTNRYADSALRHLFNFLDGKTDEDHLSACVWNCMCLMETRKMIADGTLPEELETLDGK